MRQLDYETLNPGIRRVVKLLRDSGFETTDSGDGVTNVAAGMEGASDDPHVHCVVPAAQLVQEARRLLSLFTDADLDVYPGQIQATFDPVDGVAVLSVLGIDDAALHAADKVGASG